MKTIKDFDRAVLLTTLLGIACVAIFVLLRQ